MVTRRGGNDSALALGGGQFAHAVERTTKFVCAGALKVLGLQKDLLANQVAQKVAVQNRGLNCHLTHVGQGLLEVGKGWQLSCSHKDKV